MTSSTSRGLRGGGPSGLVVAGGHLLQPDGDQQVSALDAVPLLALEQPLRATEPAACAGHLASEEQVVADPERTPRGARGIAGVRVQVMRALQAAQVVVVAAQHVGRSREQLQVLRAQRCRVVGARETLEGVEPRLRGIGITTTPELFDGIRHRIPMLLRKLHDVEIRRSAPP
jgi:hypothetical protein